MSKLIKAEDAIGWLRAVSRIMPGDIDSHGVALWHNLKATMIESIGYCQPVNAVEVVQCGECRLCDTAKCPMSGSPGRVSASDFCSYGERR